MKKEILAWLVVLGICQPIQAQQVERLSDAINTRYPELAPCVSPLGNTLYFVRSHHPDNINGRASSMDIWVSKKNKQSEWMPAKRAQDSLNDEWANSVQSVLAGDNRLLVRGAYKNGEYVGIGWSFAERKRKNWSAPKQIDIPRYASMQRGEHSSAFLSADGRVLLLGFSEKAGSETADLYICFLDSLGNWSAPKNLGTAINTPDFVEDTPFLAADGKSLYFASNRPDGYGQLDIYKSERQDETWQKWSKPINLGRSINSRASESWFSMPASGECAYMVAYEPEKSHTSDIVRITLPEWAKPKPVVLMTGKIYDQRTHQPLEARIVCEELSGQKAVFYAVSNPEDSSYQMVLPHGNHYGLRAEVEGYWPVSLSLDLSQGIEKYQTLVQSLFLAPIELGAALPINNLFFELNRADILPASMPELERLADLLQLNPRVSITIEGHTDSTGNETNNLLLSQKRAEAVKQFLLSKKISEQRIAAQGLGSAVPIIDNSTEQNRQKNRRVAFRIVKI